MKKRRPSRERLRTLEGERRQPSSGDDNQDDCNPSTPHRRSQDNLQIALRPIQGDVSGLSGVAVNPTSPHPSQAAPEKDLDAGGNASNCSLPQIGSSQGSPPNGVQQPSVSLVVATPGQQPQWSQGSLGSSTLGHPSPYFYYHHVHPAMYLLGMYPPSFQYAYAMPLYPGQAFPWFVRAPQMGPFLPLAYLQRAFWSRFLQPSALRIQHQLAYQQAWRWANPGQAYQPVTQGLERPLTYPVVPVNPVRAPSSMEIVNARPVELESTVDENSHDVPEIPESLVSSPSVSTGVTPEALHDTAEGVTQVVGSVPAFGSRWASTTAQARQFTFVTPRPSFYLPGNGRISKASLRATRTVKRDKPVLLPTASGVRPFPMMGYAVDPPPFVYARPPKPHWPTSCALEARHPHLTRGVCFRNPMYELMRMPDPLQSSRRGAAKRSCELGDTFGWRYRLGKRCRAESDSRAVLSGGLRHRGLLNCQKPYCVHCRSARLSLAVRASSQGPLCRQTRLQARRSISERNKSSFLTRSRLTLNDDDSSDGEDDAQKPDGQDGQESGKKPKRPFGKKR